MLTLSKPTKNCSDLIASPCTYFRNTQQASFNFGQILSLQDDWKTKSLLIKVDDTEQRKEGNSVGRAKKIENFTYKKKKEKKNREIIG